MKTWDKVRNFWLAAALVSSSLVLLKVALTPLQKPSLPTYTFPASLSLPGWQFVQATPIGLQKNYTPSLATSVDDLTISGQQSRYLRNGKAIEIEMRYFVSTYTDVADIVKDATVMHDRMAFAPRQSSVGTHAVYQHLNRVYATACIPSTLETTLTNGELRIAQNRPDVLLRRGLPWFFGQIPMRDLRCLWTRMSMPIDANSPITTQTELEQAWSEWVGWWQKNYPPEP